MYSIFDYDTQERVWRGCGSDAANSWLDGHPDGKYAVYVWGFDDAEVTHFFGRDNVKCARDWDTICSPAFEPGAPTWW